jgi:hypothetical protein
MTFTLTHVPVSRPYAQSIPVGHSFSFHNQVPAAALGQTPPSLSATPPIFLTQPFTITVHYNDTEIIGMEENTLGLYHWDDLAEDWQPLATTLDLPGNQAIANSSELGLFALFAADPDQAGPGIGEPIYYYNTVLNNQELFVAVPISDTLSGDHGVQAATLNYGYTSPFTEMALMGSSLSNTGDGHWLFTIPPQTQVTERATLKFWIEAKDGDLTPEASVNNNMGAYYSVTIVAPPIAGFTATPIEGNAPLVVAFTNTSTGAYDSSLWHFGDGNTSTLSDPTHIYEKPGMYTVTLTVSGQAGDDTTRVYLPNCEFVTLLQADLAQNSAQNAGIARKLVTQRPICHATADF